ncbi:O-antigen ligase family protein [Pontibacter anaerobius]|uniref:O-antigen ligase family protein n=1 Tax=Pontibacter anaerobius TaxID=2993940 RepID=A0ABT3RI51_9BACT|nr:O-antigen ligase family protein [Pontibacter anaerobius]MCX2741548.1 O-antigen ligase family protein [Pontibacter anaerobius]
MMQLLNYSVGSKYAILQQYNLKVILLGAFVGSVLFNRSLSVGILAIFIILWLFSSPLKEKVNILLAHKAVLLLPALFLLFTVSLLYSKHNGLPYLEKELLLLVLPIVIGSIHLSTGELKGILRVYTIACLLFTIVSFFEAYQFYNLPTEHFSIEHLPHQLSDRIHTPYLSLLLVLGNLSILLINNDRKHFYKTDLLLCLYFSVFLLILSSRTALFSNFILLVAYLYFKLAKQKKIGLYITFLVILVAAIGLSFKYYAHFQDRFTAIVSSGYGVSERITIYRASLSIIQEHPLTGVGIGDIQAELDRVYLSWGLPEHFLLFNPHNQYLHVTMAVGIVGLLLLLYLMLHPVFIAVRASKPMHVAFYLLFLIVFLTEVVLSRYWGVASFAFFYTIFTVYLMDQKQPIITTKEVISEAKV